MTKTDISRDVTEDEVLAFGQSLRDPEDPSGIHLLNKFKANQLIAKLMRGAIQMGYRKRHFDAAYHMRENQTEDAPQMHSSCTALLSKLVCKIAGYRHYTLLQTRDANSPSNVLYIDPFGICLMFGVEKCTQQLLTVMVDLDIQIQSKFVTKPTNSRLHGPTYNPRALQHLPRGTLPAGQQHHRPTSHREEAQAARETRAEAKAKAKARHPPEPKGPPPQQDRWQRHGRYDQWHEDSSGARRYDGQFRWNNNQWDR